MSTQHWTKLGSDPPARASHTTSCIAGPHTGQRHPLLMVVGGWDISKRRLGDVWLLDVNKGLWSEVIFMTYIQQIHLPLISDHALLCGCFSVYMKCYTNFSVQQQMCYLVILLEQ